MASKTRDKLIEAAKQVFMLKGVEHTTINDIAAASDKGRRTIYTYFKNKREIFHAVLERESDNMVSALRKIVDSDLPPGEKLSAYIQAHVGRYNNIPNQNTSLRSIFSMEFLRADRMRRMVAVKEEAMLGEILDQGVARGDFDPDQASRLSRCLYGLIRASEQMPGVDPMFSGAFLHSSIEFLITGLGLRAK